MRRITKKDKIKEMYRRGIITKYQYWEMLEKNEKRLEKNRCYYAGDVIKSLDEFEKLKFNDFVFICDKIISIAWCKNYQFSSMAYYIKKGIVRFAHKKEGKKTSFEKMLEKKYGAMYED